jgi:hypothetical protein
LYPWHPWFELQVAIHEAIEKADGAVFRCTVSGCDADRWLEVPAWMFERAVCLDHDRLIAAPFIDMTALSALADLLRQALKDLAASLNTPLSGTSESSLRMVRLPPTPCSDRRNAKGGAVTLILAQLRYQQESP